MTGIKRLLRSAFRPKDPKDDVPGNERPIASSDAGDPFKTAGTPKAEHAAPFAGKAKPEPVPKRDEPAPAEPETPPAENVPDEEPADNGGYDIDSAVSEFYDRLFNTLRSYGVTGIPSFSELYGLLASFLRPATEAAIADRERRGRQNMAELDADAYARGMGGSSYLSSVKQREMEGTAADIAALEGKYAASMGEYLYKALSAMQEMEQAYGLAMLSLSGKKGSSRSYHSSSAEDGTEDDGTVPYGHTEDGAYFDGVWYEGDFSYLERDYTYGDYVRYLRTLSSTELFLFFNSNEREWRIKRWQLQYNLPQADYLDIVALFAGMANASPGGAGVWTAQLY